jgi:hypothetical protein
MKLVLLASLLSFGSLGLGPCSSDKKSEPPASAPGSAVAVGAAAAANTDGTAIPSTPPIGVAGTAPTADNQACQILHKEDAEAWVGHTLDENEGRVMPVGWDCKFKTRKPYASVTLLLYVKDGARIMEQQKAAKMFGPAPVDMSGIGTSAVRAADNNIVGVVANGKLSWLLLSSNKDKPTAAAAEAIAKVVAGRM